MAQQTSPANPATPTNGTVKQASTDPAQAPAPTTPTPPTLPVAIVSNDGTAEGVEQAEAAAKAERKVQRKAANGKLYDVNLAVVKAAETPTAASKVDEYRTRLLAGRPAPFEWVDVQTVNSAPVKDAEGKPVETRRRGIIRLLAAHGFVVTPDGTEQSKGTGALTPPLVKVDGGTRVTIPGEMIVSPTDAVNGLRAAAAADVKPATEKAAAIDAALKALLALA